MVPGPKILQNQSKIGCFTKDLSKIEWFSGTSGTTSNNVTEIIFHPMASLETLILYDNTQRFKSKLAGMKYYVVQKFLENN